MIDLINCLKKYKAYNPNEENARLEFINFLENQTNCFSRQNKKGHVTSGGFVVDGAGNILLNHHKKLGRWVQFGGHADGSQDCMQVAKREVFEETGIQNLRLAKTEIFNVAVVEIPPNPKTGEEAHLHYDINFLFIAPAHEFKISSESLDIKWVSVREARKLAHSQDESLLRMIEKYEKILSKSFANN